MRRIRQIVEDEMVATYLLAELTSDRFGGDVRAALEDRGISEELLTAADLSIESQNSLRRELLGQTRGYGQDREMFRHFPDRVTWVRALLDADELRGIRYVDYSYWNELSGGTRRPIDAARRISDGVTVFGVPNDRFLVAAEAVRHGATFPPVIVAGTSYDALVCLEGHLRLTAYALAGFPDDVECLIGTSRDLERWAE